VIEQLFSPAHAVPTICPGRVIARDVRDAIFAAPSRFGPLTSTVENIPGVTSGLGNY
jgi:hypothetical protein